MAGTGLVNFDRQFSLASSTSRRLASSSDSFSCCSASNIWLTGIHLVLPSTHAQSCNSNAPFPIRKLTCFASYGPHWRLFFDMKICMASILRHLGQTAGRPPLAMPLQLPKVRQFHAIHTAIHKRHVVGAIAITVNIQYRKSLSGLPAHSQIGCWPV